MKVEFTNYGIGIGHNMVITAKEFLKARELKDEMEMLVVATESFTAPNCFEYCISQEEYEYIASWLQKTSKVVFSIKESSDHCHRWLEISVITGTSCVRVRYSDDDGKTLYISKKKEN